MPSRPGFVLSSLHSRNDRAPFWPESFDSGPRSAGVTGAEGSLDAGLAKAILAGAGMERSLNSGFMGTISTVGRNRLSMSDLPECVNGKSRQTCHAPDVRQYRREFP